jgi:hypothetical protein
MCQGQVTTASGKSGGSLPRSWRATPHHARIQHVDQQNPVKSRHSAQICNAAAQEKGQEEEEVDDEALQEWQDYLAEQGVDEAELAEMQQKELDALEAVRPITCVTTQTRLGLMQCV